MEHGTERDPGARAPGPGHNGAGASEQIAVASLIQAPGDPRRFDRAEIDKAAAILRRFGMVLALAIDADGHVLAG